MVFGQPPGTVRLNAITASTFEVNHMIYYKASCELQFRRGAPRTTDEKAFWRRLCAQGHYVAVWLPDVGERIIRAHTNGEPNSTPVLHRAVAGYTPPTPSKPGALNLDESKIGTRIFASPSTGSWPKAEWYEFKTHESLPFTALGFF